MRLTVTSLQGLKRPLLITGMPRSGTTWLARLLASGPATALTGREPMNPRGRQYALGRTLTGWSRLESLSPRQRWALRASYLGVNPLVYSRYGHRRWAAPLPGVRVVVKDPFAMLSIPAVRAATGATPVLLFRHPGAALTSYRRMGWTPDLEELAPIVEDFLQRNGPYPGVTRLTGELDEVGAMAWFWNVLYGLALHDVADMDDVVVLAHHDVAQGGEHLWRSLYFQLDLPWDSQVIEQLTMQGSARPVVDTLALHNFDRPPAQVANEWEDKLVVRDRVRLEDETADVRALLSSRAFVPRPA